MAKNPLEKIVSWLRAGYPDGVPQSDYVALLGILHRSLTEVEVEKIVHDLLVATGGEEAELTTERVQAAIRAHAQQEARPEDVDRIMASLDAEWVRGSTARVEAD